MLLHKEHKNYLAMPKSKNNLAKKICVAALRLAAERSWQSITLEQIAKAAKVSSTTKVFADKNQILAAIVSYISDETVAAAGKPSVKSSPHDRLFDMMMTRFEILQKYRAGILNITEDLKRDPKAICSLLPAEAEAMRMMLMTAGLEQPQTQEVVSVAGLLVIYGLVLCIWQKDESRDLSKTMPALDRHLKRAGKAAEILFRCR